jgi:hypothetical protein
MVRNNDQEVETEKPMLGGEDVIPPKKLRCSRMHPYWNWAGDAAIFILFETVIGSIRCVSIRWFSQLRPQKLDAIITEEVLGLILAASCAMWWEGRKRERWQKLRELALP